MKNNFKKFKKVPLFLSFLLLVFACFVFLFLYKEIQKNNKMSEQTQINWQNEANKRKELKFLDHSLKATKQKRELLDAHFIQSSDVVPFLEMIEKLAPKTGAQAEVVLVDMPKDGSGLVVEIKASGYFGTLYKFLTLLENSSYELDFISTNMQKLEKGTAPDNKNLLPEWSATFRVKLLSFIK